MQETDRRNIVENADWTPERRPARMSSTEIAFDIAALFCGGLIGYCLGQKRSASGKVHEVPPVEEDVGAEGISVRPLSTDPTQSLEPLALGGNTISKLSSLVEHLPGIGINAVTAGSRFYELSFPQAVTKGLEGGSLKLMESLKCGVRANAVGSGGRIAIQGTL